MKILILHRIPFEKIRYDLCLDHEVHEVTYFGPSAALSTLPHDLRCLKVERPGLKTADQEMEGRISQANQFERVVSLSEYELMAGARIRDALNIPGPSPDQVEKVLNKVLMKELVSRAGLRVPHFISFRQFLEKGVPDWGSNEGRSKVVLKPVKGASSENVTVFRSFEELSQALAQKPIDLDGELELEEYVEGSILHIDGYVFEGKVQKILSSRYVGTCLDYVRGEPLGSYQLETCETRHRWAEAVIAAIGIQEGSFHLEVIESDEGLVFLEIANRSGGADVVPTFELATGINLYHAHLSSLLGLSGEAGSQVEDIKGFFGWFIFPGHQFAGKPCRLVGAESWVRNPRIIKWSELRPTQAPPQRLSYHSHEVPLGGLVRGSTSQEVQGLIQDIFREIRIEGRNDGI